MTAVAGESAKVGDASAASPVAVADTAPDVSTRVVAGNFRYFEIRYGRERLQRAVAEIGGPPLEYILDPENFVSLEYLSRVARVLTEASGDPQFLRSSGTHQFKDPRAFGFVFYLVRSLGSPEMYYRMAVRAMPTFNRVGEMKILELNDHHLRLSYRSLRPEGTRLICDARLGQLEGAPMLWGLASARGRERECQMDGAAACIYELDWTPPFRPLRGALLGALPGAVAGAVAAGGVGAVWGGVTGALAALVWAYRADGRAKARQIVDGATSGTEAMSELGRRFEDVQRLAAEAQTSNRALDEEMRRRKSAEAALIEAQKLEALGRLSGGIAHDFNNILTIVMGSARHARGVPGMPPDAVADLDNISEASDRAVDLVRSLLAFARRQIVEPRVLQLDEQTRRLERLLAPLVGDAVRLDFDLARERLNVLVDPGQLEQLILNLAANARDAMPDGGTLRIETRGVALASGDATLGDRLPAGDYVRLRVVDTGNGMDDATRARLFEPFFTTKEMGRGTGLGLATCHGIVLQAKGAITVESAPGAGTTVDVYLPRALAASASAAVSERKDVPGLSASPRGGGETVLVVEDDAMVRRLVTRMLTQAGYHVLAANGGDEALRIASLEAADIHLLVTDVVMHGLDGRALAERLRRQRPGVPVLFISGYSHEVISRRGALEPGFELLRKPFTDDELLARVRSILDAGRDAGEKTVRHP